MQGTTSPASSAYTSVLTFAGSRGIIQTVPRKRSTAKTLSELVQSYQARYHRYSLAFAHEVEADYDRGRIPTGLERVDMILGGGIPRGVITELFGPPGSGKTYLCLSCISSAQKSGLTCAFIDVERSYSPRWAEYCGVSQKDLLLSSPEDGEEALDIAVDLARYGVDLLVFDSIASLASREDLEKQVEIGSYAPGVRLLNVGLAKLKAATGPGRKTAIVLVNQVRDNLGVLYGPKTTTPMGWRVRHDSSLRLEIRRAEWIKRGDARVGQVSVVRIEKTKVDGTMPVGTEATFDIYFPTGAGD